MRAVAKLRTSEPAAGSATPPALPRLHPTIGPDMVDIRCFRPRQLYIGPVERPFGPRGERRR